ncbi:MAG: 1-deoxy-D-xylulose-5-phosphate reductoisomerase [Acidimicrobiia bacterium]
MGGRTLNPLVVLGVTGSIGHQTLEVAERLSIPVAAIAARRPSDALLAAADALPDAAVCVTEPGDDVDRFRSHLGGRAHFGQGALTEVASIPGKTVVNGIVGVAGLAPSLAALHAGNRLALANKESLVAGGPLILAAAAHGGGELIPVDSEHSAIWQLTAGEDPADVQRLIITASGGPFRGSNAIELQSVSVSDALNHPTWSMGDRITIDSATLMNKAFEVIEAHFLFGLEYEDIDVVVHPQSVVHSFVEFVDGVVKAEVGFPDMKKPIQYALTAPQRESVAHEPFSLAGHSLTFEEPDRAVFPCLDLGYRAGWMGGTALATLNAADEVAVQAFLDGRIPFTGIARVVEHVLERHVVEPLSGLEDVLAADAQARGLAREECARLSQ